MDAILGSSKSVRLKIDQKKYRICFEGRKSPPTSARNPDAVCPMPLKSATYRTGELASALLVWWGNGQFYGRRDTLGYFFF